MMNRIAAGFGVAFVLAAVGAGVALSQSADGEGKDVQAFRTVCGAKAAEAEKSQKMAVVGKDGWLFFGGELRFLSVGTFWGDQAGKVSRATRPEDADPTPAIIDFHNQLKAAGVELIVIPVPPKAAVYPKMLDDSAAANLQADYFLRQYYKTLTQAGVTVIDLGDVFAKTIADGKADAPAMYCKQDTHWSPAGCRAVAKSLGEKIRAAAWFAAIAKTEFNVAETQAEITGDLWNDLGEPKPAKEKIALLTVRRKAAAADSPAVALEDKTSPILLLGDSHCLVFHDGSEGMHAAGAGLADQLAGELGVMADVLGVRGSGATAARADLYRKSAADKNYLAGKKMVIWCFAARDFTESQGWRKLPVMKKE